MSISSPLLVAHRGYQKCFPENSVLGIMSAIEAGAHYIELDIQINDEGIVFLLHDANVSRICGVNDSIHTMPTTDAMKLFASEPDRLGNAFANNPLNLFDDLLPIIRRYQQVNFFIELKEESINRYGIQACFECLLNVMGEVETNCIFISFSEAAVKAAKSMGFAKTGLVIRDWYNRNALVKQCCADYIFINYQRIPEEDTILAMVPVVVYEIDNTLLAMSLLQRGAFAVETFCFNDLVG
jgi:glycerophosphoryl diester phosphodiesterase